MKTLKWTLGWINVFLALIDVGKILMGTDVNQYFMLLLLNATAAAICLEPDDK